ncbi:rifin [Plasmodium sp. gorilla clade G1]|nr:rifin [Plasmodium sp. gorilla clade G1]
MKLHYSKILLFSISLSIFVSSSYANHENKPYITEHTPNTTSRVLSECDTNTSIYNNDPDMKSVKENFDRQTSQRFEEYNKRMIKNRKKCKEQCDKDIQKIVVKDKMEKSLAEKVEKGCLMCGCGLGGGVAPVWVWSAVYGMRHGHNMFLQRFFKRALKVGLDKVTEIVKLEVLNTIDIPIFDVKKLVFSGYFTDEMTLLDIFEYIKNNMFDIMTSDTYDQYSLGIKNISENPTWISERYIKQATDVLTAVAEGKAAETTKLATTTLH